MQKDILRRSAVVAVTFGAALGLLGGCGGPSSSAGSGGGGARPASGGASVAATGGGAGTSSSDGSGASGGASGQGTGGTAAGTGGGSPGCPTPAACAVGAVHCSDLGVPETCVAGASGCGTWQAVEPCPGHQICQAGTCACSDDARCGSGDAEGDFCPVAGGSTFGHCALDGNGCRFVAAVSNGCADSQRCNAAGVVPTGTACGCPSDGDTLGTGCASQSLNDVGADTSNGAVVRCEMSGACPLWKLMVDCSSQSLTAGTVAGESVCVCKEPPATGLYVDPSPGPSTLMHGSPTGAQYPAGCRLPSLRAALDRLATRPALDHIVIAHDDPSAIHLGASSGESFPVTVPSGVTVTAAGGAAVVDPTHVVIDIGAVAAPGPAFLLEAGASLGGITLDAAGAAGAPNAGKNVTSFVACAPGVASAAPAAVLDHVIVLAKAGQTGVLAGGRCALSATNGAIDGATVGVDVARTAGGAADTASFTALDLAVRSTVPGSIGARVGTGLDGGARSSLALGRSVIDVAGAAVVVAGGTAALTDGVIRFTSGNVGSQNRGLVVSGGSATVERTGITMGEPPTTASGVNVVGAAVTGGQLVLSGVNIVGAGRFTGVDLSGTGIVTLSGSADARATVATTLPPSSPDGSSGVVVQAGASSAQLTLSGAIEVSGFATGLVLNDGTLMATGTGAEVSIAHNRGDGVRLLGRTAGPTVTLTGIAIHDNAGTGLVVRTIVPISLAACSFTGNAGDGIDVQRSQPTTLGGIPLFVLDSSTVAGNGARGVALTGKGAGAGALSGGKVAAELIGNTITSNAGIGVFVSEGADNADGDDVTEVWLESNDVAGNLSMSVPSSVMAGGVFFSGSDATTRVVLRSFLGNKLHDNGRAEIGFDLVQNDGQPWNLSASASDPSQLCGDAAEPNFIYCYNKYPGDFAIAVASAAVHVNVKGMHFQDTLAVGGRDFTAGIPSSEITAFCPPHACQ